MHLTYDIRFIFIEVRSFNRWPLPRQLRLFGTLKYEYDYDLFFLCMKLDRN
jgi:hypothetical protein